MIELAQHIEALLLENDCVIVPGLGGFVAHHTPATWVKDECIFLPPSRVIGFNPKLTMNDGLLAQSYMSVYGTTFSDATKMIDRKVKELTATLHEDGCMSLPNIGELRYTLHRTYDFVPYDDRVTTPDLYGLDSFELKELPALQTAVRPQPQAIRVAQPAVAAEQSRRPHRNQPRRIKFRPAYLSQIVAAAAAVLLFFFISTPIENTEVVEGNYAQLLPLELFEKIEKQSVAITPISLPQQPQHVVTKPVKKADAQKAVVPVSAKEVKVEALPIQDTKKIEALPINQVGKQEAIHTSKQAETIDKAAPAKKAAAPKTQVTNASAKRFHIIVASVATRQDAEAMTKRLQSEGYPNAQVVTGNGKMRVSIDSHASQTDAYRALKNIRKNTAYEQAWVLKN